MRKLFPRAHKRELPNAVLACSGGLDSMVLLDLLRAFYSSQGAGQKLLACYVNHCQRPDSEIAQDRAVIRKYCRAHGVAFRSLRLTKVAKGASEATLRRARYRALGRVALAAGRASGGSRGNGEGAAVVFTAHHAQDNLETLLFRLMRGAHPETIKGIAVRTRLKDGPRLARPLLPYGKEELLEHARWRGLEWSEDSTNHASRFARNRIRHELLPLLESLRPGSAARVSRFFAALEASRPRKSAQPPAERVHRARKGLLSTAGLPVSASDFGTLKLAVDGLLGEQAGRTTHAHWESMRRQLVRRMQLSRRGGGPRKTVQFPGGHALRFEGARVRWTKP